MQNDFDRVQSIIKGAFDQAKVERSEYITIEHLLEKLLDDEQMSKLFEKHEIDIDGIKTDLRSFLETSEYIEHDESGHDFDPKMTLLLERILHQSRIQAAFFGMRMFNPAIMFMALLDEDETHAVYFLNKYGVLEDEILDEIARSISPNQESTVRSRPMMAPGMMTAGGMHTQPISQDEALQKYCINLNERALAGKFDDMVGREPEIMALQETLLRKNKPNVVLTGKPGVGKSQIVEGLAKKIIDSDVPEELDSAIIYLLDLGALVAGTRFRGDFEERIKAVIEAAAADPNIIMFIDEVHMILGAGSASGSMDAANLLKPALARGEIRVIGATTEEEFRRHFEKDRALMRRFFKVPVEEPTIQEAKEIMRAARVKLEAFHGLKYDDDALDAAVDLTARYVPGRCLPDKAIDALDMSGAKKKIQKKKKVKTADITEAVARLAKLPIETIQESDARKLEHLKNNLEKEVYGQDEALEFLTDAVIIGRSGLREPGKPQASVLFRGPTGVGKTETAKKLAELLSLKFIRLDMSEYAEGHTISALKGSPPGYAGYEDGAGGAGGLINKIEENPACVLLLDEIEKAHPVVRNLFLQVMDYGKCTSSSGKEVSFENVILIMTSNAGAVEDSKPVIGFGRSEEENDSGRKEFEMIFTPEFRNRFDAIIKFKQLGDIEMSFVVEKMVREMNTLMVKSEITLVINKAVKDWLVTEAKKEKMGARPVARLINTHLKKPMSKLLAFGKVVPGTKVQATLKNGEIVLDF